MSTMKAIQVSEPGADFELVELPIPDVGPDEVRVKVEACGVCHSDAFVKEGQYPGIDYPRVPGHEVIGIVDAVGSEVDSWSEGERVGVGWHGGHCFDCDACREGDFILCENAEVTGIHFDGGYAEYMTAPYNALARVPEGLESAEAAPLLCAGITVYNALRNSKARPGDLIAVQGIGGLGHLALQYADAMGFETAAISSSPDKEAMAHEMGATHFINADGAAERLQELGGADVILATAPNSKAMSEIIGGLGRNGEMIVVAASGEPIEVSPMALIGARRSVSGWASGDARDSEDTLNFSELTHSIPEIETFALADAAEAYSAMMNNEVRFRAVLTME
jgi:alcohol dehydrogenase/propanol-preferring alcohol dehydrogenase